jgi:hypothetical protein
MASDEPFVPNEHFFQTVAVAQQLMAQRAEAEEVSVIFFQAIFINDVLWSGADALSVTVDSNYTVGDALFKLLREQGPYKVTGVTPFKVVKIMEFTLTDRKEVDPDSRVHRGQTLRAWLVEIDKEEEPPSDDSDKAWVPIFIRNMQSLAEDEEAREWQQLLLALRGRPSEIASTEAAVMAELTKTQQEDRSKMDPIVRTWHAHRIEVLQQQLADIQGLRAGEEVEEDKLQNALTMAFAKDECKMLHKQLEADEAEEEKDSDIDIEDIWQDDPDHDPYDDWRHVTLDLTVIHEGEVIIRKEAWRVKKADVVISSIRGLGIKRILKASPDDVFIAQIFLDDNDKKMNLADSNRSWISNDVKAKARVVVIRQRTPEISEDGEEGEEKLCVNVKFTCWAWSVAAGNIPVWEMKFAEQWDTFSVQRIADDIASADGNIRKHFGIKEGRSYTIKQLTKGGDNLDIKKSYMENGITDGDTIEVEVEEERP